jgi:hypothetical protein
MADPAKTPKAPKFMKKIENWVKKNPVLAGGIVLVVILGIYLYLKTSNGTAYYSGYPEAPSGIGSSGGGDTGTSISTSPTTPDTTGNTNPQGNVTTVTSPLRTVTHTEPIETPEPEGYTASDINQAISKTLSPLSAGIFVKQGSKN